MKNKGKLCSIALALIVFFLISISFTALAASTEGIESKLTITETQITTNKSFQDSPAIHGNRIVWSDNRNGNWDIYMYDISTSKETQITTNKSNQYYPAIYGNRIVWLDTRNRDYDIYMYDISTSTETYISSASGSPAIYGDRIVWQNNPIFGSGLYMYNISTSKINQTTNSSQASSPSIYGDRVVWIDMRTGDYNIYVKNISTSKEIQITTSRTDKKETAIYGDIIAWKEYRNGYWNIYTYNLSTSAETQVTTNGSFHYNSMFSMISNEDFAIHNDRIVWMDDRDGDEKYDIYMYNLSTSKETQITTNKSNQKKPDIFGDRIVWADNRNDNYDQSTINYDIYMGTISNIPYASFSATSISGIAPLEVGFTDESTGLFTSRKWDFGDETSSTEENPIHIYNEAGEYVVNLTISNGKDTSSRTLEIDVQEAIAPPEVDFKTNVTSGYVPFSVMFTDISQNATARAWDFNNDSIIDSTEKNPVYVYTSPGTYTVNLTVSNTKGVTSKKMNITASPAQRVDGQLTLTESRITTNESIQINPDIYDNKIVWMDGRSGSNIYMYDLFTSKETQLMDYYSKVDPQIYGDRVVYMDIGTGDRVHVYNVSSMTDTWIRTTESGKGEPAIYKDKIIWSDNRNGNWDIYIYNLSSYVETQITNNKSSQQNPAIYGDRIVWQDNRDGEIRDEYGNLIDKWNIYMYDLSTSSEIQITTSGSAQCPDIYGDRIVWMDNRNGNWDIYMYNLSTSKETQITDSELVQRYPAIYGDRIVWESYREGNVSEGEEPDNYHIYMFDIFTSKETKITTIESLKTSPAIYDNKIVWTDYRNGNSDIYMCIVKNVSKDDRNADDGKTDENISERKSHSSSGGSSGGGSPEPARNVEVKELCQVFITNGNLIKFDFTQNATCIVSVRLDSKKTVGKTTTIVEQLKNRSTLTSNLTEGEVYKYFNIWVGNSGFVSSENIENPTICFKIEKSWLQNKSIDQDSITLNRYTNKTWEQLSANLTGEDDKYLYFRADVPGFSFFAITGKQCVSSEEAVTEIQSDDSDNSENKENTGSEINTEPKKEEKRDTPGFEIVYGVAGLLGISLYRRR